MRKRLVLGVEQLFGLGFRHDLKRAGLSDAALRKLHGNTQCVHFLAHLAIVQLCNVDFEVDYLADFEVA